ncbi:hypothetical protein IE53DRAFT_54076 [Violaceomyces palustris]|uniref:Uncharacterized protein n=1 Tax=Violaceomyces palustris TaxID=1673888 RepID=A0ACD0P7K8_9BASI|nr:hypothetical protein IE53DRAFT_54076 [Violaceomyces palustris]
MLHGSNTKLNAAGLAPEHSMQLPERQPEADEQHILNAIHHLYTSPQAEPSCFEIFANEAILTLPTGDVVVGPQGIRSKFADLWQETPIRSLRQRLLTTPESLPLRTIVLDQVLNLYPAGVSDLADETPTKTIHSLIVIKRKPQDGKISSFVEEEGHRKATAPLAVRAAAANNFYSPTDSQLSPVTSKLNLAKKRHHLKGKPTSLFANHSGLRQSVNEPGSPAPSNAAGSEMEF